MQCVAVAFIPTMGFSGPAGITDTHHYNALCHADDPTYLQQHAYQEPSH